MERLVTQYRWLQGEQDVGSHLLKDNEWDNKAERVLKHAARGPECWDCEFYRSSNIDLAELPCHDAFAHFVNYGQFEPSRPFRYELLQKLCCACSQCSPGRARHAYTEEACLAFCRVFCSHATPYSG